MRKLNSILFSLSFLTGAIFLIFYGCNSASDAPKQLKGKDGSIIEHFAPVYKTKACFSIEDDEERRMCGDRQLVDDITSVAMKAHGNDAKPENVKLVIEFYVLVNGKTEPINVSRSVSRAVDMAAMKFIQSTSWQPAIHEGELMKIRKRIPISLDF